MENAQMRVVERLGGDHPVFERQRRRKEAGRVADRDLFFQRFFRISRIDVQVAQLDFFLALAASCKCGGLEVKTPRTASLP